MSPEITKNIFRLHVKSIEVDFNRNHDNSHDIIEIVIFTLFQACVTFKSALLYIFLTKTHKKAIVRLIYFIIIILSHYTMTDKTKKSVICYYFGNNYINIRVKRLKKVQYM